MTVNYVPDLTAPEDIPALRFWTQAEYARISTAFLQVVEEYTSLIDDRMRWRGVWVPGTYQENDVVYDQGWLMIANKETTDRAAPQPQGEAFYILDETDPGWTVQSPNSTFVATGHRYVFGITGYFNGYKVYLPDIDPDVYYRIATTVIYPNGDEVSDVTPEFQGNAVGWLEIDSPTTLVSAGTTLEIVLGHENRASILTVNANYNYTSSNQAVVPGVGAAHRRNNRTWVRFNKQDADANLDPLAGVVAGTHIKVTDVSDWTVNTVTDAGTYYEYEIAGTGNPTNGLTAFIFEIPSANVPQPYVENLGYWTANPPATGTITGYLNIGGSVTELTDDAYGVDILVQYATISDDWDLMAVSEDVAIGGGGGGESNTSSNVGAGEGLALAKVGVDLPFKTLESGTNVTLTPTAQTVIINASGGIPEVPNDGRTYLRRFGEWVPCQCPGHESEGAFYETEILVEQSGTTSNNNGFERMFDSHGTATPQAVASKNWTFARILTFDAGSNQKGISVGFRDENTGTAIPDADTSWTFFEIENKPANPSYSAIWLRTELNEYSPLSGTGLEATAWLRRPGADFNFALGLQYDVRFFDLPMEVFTLAGATVGNITGFIKDVQGSLTPSVTANGLDIYGIWFDGNENSWSFALVDTDHVLSQKYFGAIHMKDGSGNLVPSNEVSQKPDDATLIRGDDGTYKYTQWKWTGVGGSWAALTVWISGMEQP